MKKEIWIEFVITALMIILFLYTGFSKYADFEYFERAMHKQHFPVLLERTVVLILPPVEIITALIIIPEKTRYVGLVISISLLSAFTLYIAGILLHVFPRTPCPCGGIVRTFNWSQHLVFNIVLMILNLVAILIHKRVFQQKQ